MTQLPLHPVGCIERIKVRVLSALLYLANGDVGRGGWGYDEWVKFRFYTFIKSPILRTYATATGQMDVQRIVRECRGCGGTGLWGSHRSDGGSVCFRCNGTGVYRTDHFGLARYDLGGRVFHQPVLKWIGTMPPADMPVTIEGRIDHRYRGTKAVEALLWLALVYDRRLFAFLMHPERFITERFVFYPLVAIQSTLHLWLMPGYRARRLWAWVRSNIPRRCSVCGRINRGLYACDACLPF